MINIQGPEILEVRIAPATFLVSSSSLIVSDQAGNDAKDLANEIQAATDAGADSALLLATGDKLVFDSNRNGRIDAADALLVQVRGGSAMVFLTDFDGSLTFSRSEISGLAVSDGFDGLIKTDVNGTVGTFLNPANEVSYGVDGIVLQPGSIAGLQVQGAIVGDLIAGGRITNVEIGKPLFMGSGFTSVNAILTGTAADARTVTLGMAAAEVLDFAVTGAGGDITEVTLARGAELIQTGRGANSGAGDGFKGGSIDHITINDVFSGVRMLTGDGGNGAPNGGASGSITNVTLKGKVNDGDVELSTGNGGVGGAAVGFAGDSGSIEDVLVSLGYTNGEIYIRTGDGGSTQIAVVSGGKSGQIDQVTIEIGSRMDGSIEVLTGNGGNGFGAFLQGSQGLVSNLNIIAPTLVGSLSVGGNTAGRTGYGSILWQVSIAVDEITGDLTLRGGAGGDDTGLGGHVTDSSIKVGHAFGDIIISGGAGGNVTGTGGVGGAGGSVQRVLVTGGIVDGAVRVEGGEARRGMGGSDGGWGGNLEDITIKLAGVGGVELHGGDGEQSGNFGGNGGNGGSVTRNTVTVSGQVGHVEVSAGAGGDGHNAGFGGAAGSVSHFKLTAGLVFGTIGFVTQNGGSTNDMGIHGGAAGAIEQVTVKVARSIGGDVLVRSGDGGDAGLIGNGGVGGSIDGLLLSAANIGSSVMIETGAGGAGGDDEGANRGSGDGGTGGGLSNINVAITRDVMGSIALATGSGGSSSESNTSGAGGAAMDVRIRAGSVSGVSVLTGRGGDGGIGTGGAGGAIDGVVATVGAIVADEALFEAGAGGNATGLGGVGGAGGTADGVSLTIKSGVLRDLRVAGGNAGDGDGAGATGGYVAGTKLNLGAGLFLNSLSVRSGDGGNSDALFGGEGGDLRGVNVVSAACHLGQTIFETGNGGSVELGALAGSGGSVSEVMAKFTGSLGNLAVRSGSGGEGDYGGSGGMIEKVTLVLSGKANEDATTVIRSGNGGNADKFVGGLSGGILGAKVMDSRAETKIRIATGDGGSGIMGGGFNSYLGEVNVIAPNGVLELIGGNGGDASGSEGSGGIGATIGRVVAKVNVFRAIAGDGGVGAAGIGGHGGLIEGLKVTASGGAQQIRAGAGGDGLTQGGDGGGVIDVKVTGDIGDFYRPFGIGPFEGNPQNDMGGLFAGTGGKGATDGVAGSIANVTAKRIASILAVNDATLPTSLGVANAVTAISGIKAKVIGSDIGGDGAFTFNDAGGTSGFDADSGDQAIDGLVIVKTIGVPVGGLRPTPLLIIAV